jgi:hypothetical protein
MCRGQVTATVMVMACLPMVKLLPSQSIQSGVALLLSPGLCVLLQAFLQMSPPLDPATVLDILHQHSPEYCGM